MASWIEYANQGATRSMPLSQDLIDALSFLPELGLTARVFSGGQPTSGAGPRVGSTRHDLGGAADVMFYRDGQPISWQNPDDLPTFQEIVRRGRAAGLTGFGAGEGYMTPGSMHVGFGAPAVWGAGGRSANAPDWLREAYGSPVAATASSRGTTMDGMQQGPRGLLEFMGIQRRDPSAEGETALPFYQRPRFADFMGGLAVGLNELRQRPSQAIPQIVMAGQERRQQAQTANQTVAMLRQRGRDDLADAVGSGALTAREAVGLAYQQPEQTAAMQNYNYLIGQGVSPEEALQRAFSGGTTINVGGQPTTPGWEAIDRAYAETWLRDSVSGVSDAAAQAATISTVLGQLEAGQELTGPMVGVQPDFVRAILNPAAQDAKDRVEQVVQRSLRETLGAQFTQAEGDRLIARAYNPSLPPETNAARLRVLFTQLEAVNRQKLALREYFNENGTLQGFSGPVTIPTIDDFIAAMDAVSPQTTGSSAAGGSRIRLDAEGNEIND